MKYEKPAVIDSKIVDMAKCGAGPSGRPCSNRA